jgi:hypothetical protein
MLRAKDASHETPFGNFAISSRKNLTFSDKLQKEITRIEKLKWDEEMQGIAINNPTYSIKMTKAK